MPTAQRLATNFRVTGIDVSTAQIEAARVAVPAARFLVADMLEVDFPPASLDAAIALYSLIHVPNAALPGLLARIHDWLVPGGRFLAVLGTVAGEGIEADWLGVPMFFAGQPPAANRN